jgi:hypothetical protein
MVKRRSNGTNAFMLGIYTVIDMAFAFFMIGGAFVSTAAIVIFIAASLFALVYNVMMMSFAVKLEEC